MNSIIWLAIVLYIVIMAIKKSKQNTPAQSNVKKRAEKINSPNNHPRPQAAQNTMQRQPVRPAANQPRYAGNQTAAARPVPQKSVSGNSILERAKLHAEEQFADDTVANRGSMDLNRVPSGDEIMKDKAKARHIHSEHAEHSHDSELRNQVGVDDLDTYHLINEVNDLIVKGYSGNLNFERDFIAEGTDMLNRMYG